MSPIAPPIILEKWFRGFTSPVGKMNPLSLLAESWAPPIPINAYTPDATGCVAINTIIPRSYLYTEVRKLPFHLSGLLIKTTTTS